MLIVKSMDVRNHFRKWCQKVISGETIVVSRPKNENIYLISESEYNELVRARRNTEYLETLDRSQKQLESGDVVHRTQEELRAMEDAYFHFYS